MTITAVTTKNWKNEDVINQQKTLIVEEVNKYDVILVGDTMYKNLCNTAVNYKWNRIFIDEADTIKMTRDNTLLNFDFLWLITGTPSGLFGYNCKPYLKTFIGDTDTYGIKNSLVVKNDDNYIDQSITLPRPKRLQIKCLTPKELNIIKDFISPNILQMINAGNSEEAIKALNCNVDTNDNILQIITKSITDSIVNKKIELEAEMKKNYNIAQQKERDARIKTITVAIAKLEEKYDDIRKKIYDLNGEYCPVCIGSFTMPVIVSCCKSCFCFDCLAVSLGELHTNKCPCCRRSISKNDVNIISNDTSLVKVSKEDVDPRSVQHDKLDVLVELIQKKSNGSFMVFANYYETLQKIEQKFKELGITYHILKGHTGTIDRYITEFENKKVKVLLLNAQYFGAGMNLQMTSDLVIYHRFNKEMEEQIIGRAQRMGRTTPLNVYYLLHDNESTNMDNNFKFEDVKDIHYTDWLKQAELEMPNVESDKSVHLKDKLSNKAIIREIMPKVSNNKIIIEETNVNVQEETNLCLDDFLII
jgi:hypothetical protein